MGKGSKDSFAGQALSHIMCMLMINNLCRIQIHHILTAENVVADHLSHVTSESSHSSAFPTLMKGHEKLHGCCCFLPSTVLVFDYGGTIGECLSTTSLSKQVTS